MGSQRNRQRGTQRATLLAQPRPSLHAEQRVHHGAGSAAGGSSAGRVLSLSSLLWCSRTSWTRLHIWSSCPWGPVGCVPGTSPAFDGPGSFEEGWPRSLQKVTRPALLNVLLLLACLWGDHPGDKWHPGVPWGSTSLVSWTVLSFCPHSCSRLRSIFPSGVSPSAFLPAPGLCRSSDTSRLPAGRRVALFPKNL